VPVGPDPDLTAPSGVSPQVPLIFYLFIYLFILFIYLFFIFFFFGGGGGGGSAWGVLYWVDER
jgi:hypothetical protein